MSLPRTWSILTLEFCHVFFFFYGEKKALIKPQRLKKLIGRYWGGMGEGKKERWEVLTLDDFGGKLQQVMIVLFLHSSNR